MDKLKVLVVDDHPMVLEGMHNMLSRISFVSITGMSNGAEPAMEQIQADMPDIVITDISMPGMNGVELTARIRKEYPGIKVIAMSTFNERSLISQMIEQGASGYLLKNASREEIEEALLTVKENRLYMNLDLEWHDTGHQQVGKTPVLTSREKEVLLLIAEGFTNSQIAEKIFVSPYTVDSHRKNLLTKFEVGNTAGLIKLAAKHGLV